MELNRNHFVSSRLIASFVCAALVLGACATTQSTTASSGATKKYPLDVCIVTDNKLGSMGDPITIVYNGQEVSFCCKPCVKEFEADQQKFLAKLPVTATK